MVPRKGLIDSQKTCPQVESHELQGPQKEKDSYRICLNMYA